MGFASERIDLDQWKLVWNDEFDYPDEQLEEKWTAQHSASGGFVISSRWRENVVVRDGILELINRKESRGGQDWTSGSTWTNERFHYGYYEARYKYAGATGTNNSFWMWPRGGVGEGEKAFEMDVNEGHYPNEINTNVHNWTDKWIENGVEKHEDDPKHFTPGSLPISEAYSHVLQTPVSTKRIRFSSTHGAHFHIREFRAYAPNEAGYPVNVLSETADTDVAGLVNHTRATGTSITASGFFNDNSKTSSIADGKVLQGSWISQMAGDKWLEIEWDQEKEIGAIQFVNGWLSGGKWKALISNYRIQYHDGESWQELVDFDSVNGIDYSEEYHTYGLEWNETEMKFYFDGELIRTKAHTLNHSLTNIYLSLAILDGGIAGAVTDAIDGTSMKVDYVRYYQKRTDVPVSDVSLSPGGIVMEVGEEYTLNVSVIPGDATNRTVSFSSSRPEVASVDASGKVQAASEGRTIISAITEDGEKVASSVIYVGNIVSTENAKISEFTMRGGNGGPELVLRYPRLSDLQALGLEHVLEYSDDLSSWSEIGEIDGMSFTSEELSFSEQSGVAQLQTVVQAGGETGSAPGFFRVKVNEI
ncbi:family 16 glycosylhydrolase [Pelagicoccus mobilis]|uniref:Family 16 glycosylhydrolase n=1 Tax=Pelagicoccus mobilis TaxID=415221 RepID=A0A934VJT1_9BACT|nr:family 16 glycosylhydrolase [Pelagicoccus mobilis]MBK1875946.1 family 16 glycosylhydrolase [Pelagicoccus mobilis]